jgi:hypothetical protein
MAIGERKRRRPSDGYGASKATPINHAAKPAGNLTRAVALSNQMRHAGDQRVPGTVEFIHARCAVVAPRDRAGQDQACREGLTYNQRAELWRIVDYRELCLQMLVRISAELERIDREIEQELRR